MATMEFFVLGLILLGSGEYCGCEVVRLTPNVALTGTASQSSTYSNSGYSGSPFIASYAIDGDYETSVTKNGGRCAILGSTAPVWWQVHLHRVFQINKVALTSIGSNNWHTLRKNIYIDVSNKSDGSAAVQCAHDPYEFNDGETRVYTCPCRMFGRYVRIRYPVGDSSNMRLCEVQIQPAGCPEPEEKDNAVRSVPNTEYVFGTNVTYTCDECYTGGGISTCQRRTAEWSRVEECTRFFGYCPEPEQIDNAKRFIPDTPYVAGTNVTYMCDRCYTGGGISTCQCNGEWSAVYECTSILRCKDPGSIENGEMEGSPPFTCVSTVKYTCNEGYWLLGTGTLRCGIGGKWDHAKPVCIKKGHGCGEPPKLPNFQRFGSVTRITYECNDGYTGGGAATCWHGAWKLNGSCNSNTSDDDKETERCNCPVCRQTAGVNGRLETTTGPDLNGGDTSEDEQIIKKETEKCNCPVCRQTAGDTSEDEENTKKETEKCNCTVCRQTAGINGNRDGLVLGLTAVSAFLGGIGVALVAVFLYKRRGIGHLARAQPSHDDSRINRNFQTSNVDNEYAELSDMARFSSSNYPNTTPCSRALTSD